MAFSSRVGTNWCHDFPKLARESGFRFNRHGRRVRVDWECISSIDIDRVICERDLSAIDDNVNNIVDCCLENEYDVKILDSNFVKLFRLAQLAIEYLLYCKRYLDHSVVILKDELRSKIEENAKLNNRARVSEDTVKELKDKLKERSRYTETKLSDSHGEIHKCPQCPKTFISSVFMSAHANRRHPSSRNLSQLNSSSPIPDERYRDEAEKLHNEIKTLKERLNLVERPMRKESDKLLLSSDSIAASTGDRKGKRDENSRDEDELKEEQQDRQRYQEEIKNFKEMLFSEIRQEQNLKLAEKFSLEREKTDDYTSGNAKELIRQQEKEIQRLRGQLHKRLTPDIEDIKVNVDNQDDLWQSKIENLERRHRADIEKLYTQLKITRESADQMRIDYITKINYLEREYRERDNKSTHLPDGNMARTSRYFLSSDRGDSANENIPPPVGSQPKNHLISSKTNCAKEGQVGNYHRDESVANVKLIVNENTLVGESRKETTNYHNHCHKDKKKRSKMKLGGQTSLTLPRDESHVALINRFDENHLSNSFDDPRQDAARVFGPRIVGAERAEGLGRVKESFATIKNVGQRSAMYRSEKSIRDKLESSDSATESEASSGISSSESWLESEGPDVSEAVVDSQKENTEESRISRIKVKSNNRNEPINQERIIDDIYIRQRDSKKSENKDTIEQLNLKLRDLGVDPEWQGIPKATLKQIMETVRHHRNLNCKKYRKLEGIRRELFEQVTEKLSSETKIVYSLDEGSPESSSERFLKNVKGDRAWKTPSILNKNEESHSELTKKPARKDLANNSNEIIENEPSLRRAKKSKSREQTNCKKSEESQISKRVPRVIKNNSAALRKQPQSTVHLSEDSTVSDLKYLSDSYESLKNFHRYEGANNPRQQRAVWEGKINVPGTLVTSTPERNEEVEKVATMTRQARDSLATFTKNASTMKMQDEFFSNSPRNRAINRSVIKSATRGSAASLVKKKVVFDLEDKAGDSPESLTNKDNNHGNTTRASGESDCEISSINDEINEKEADREEKQLVNIVFKSFQSEKIARISKQIEQQLSVARRKPIGSVEAMFVDKLAVTKDVKKPAVLETPKLHLDIIPSGRDTIGLPEAAPRTSRNLSSDPRRNINNLLNYGSNDLNLDKDIDELLEIE